MYRAFLYSVILKNLKQKERPRKRMLAARLFCTEGNQSDFVSVAQNWFNKRRFLRNRNVSYTANGKLLFGSLGQAWKTSRA